MPTVVKALRGTLRPDRVNPAEPAALPVSSLAAPTWLDDEGRKVFRRLARHLSKMRVLSEADLPLLSLLADQWAVYFAARRFLKDQGSDCYTLRDADGNVRAIQPFPQVARMNKAALAIARLSAEFGLSPSARSRVNAAPADDEPGDELDGYLSGARRA